MSLGRFHGKGVLVTGGNSGIGLATAKAFATEGARVAIVARDAERLSAAKREIGGDVTAVQADLATLPGITIAIDKVGGALGRIDILFLNAGVAIMAPIEKMTEETWDSVMNINVKSAFFTVQQALPLMGEGAAIVLCSSVAVSKVAPGSSLYSASKGALNALGRALAAELVTRRIRVTAVMPGAIDTPMAERTMDAERARAVKGRLAEQTPLKRLGTPEDIAAAVLFLCSDEASFITATELLIDGGMLGIP